MTKVYGIMGLKGGTGKTTIATALAGEYALKDEKVLLIDADPSQNLKLWWTRSAENGLVPENVEFISVSEIETLNDIMRRKSDFSAIVIDTASQETKIRHDIIEHLDAVITPVKSFADDYHVNEAAQIVRYYNRANERSIKHLIVKTRQTSEEPVAHEASLPTQSVLIQNSLIERDVYREIERNGFVQTQEMTRPVEEARTEIKSMVVEIEQKLAA